MPVFEYDVKMTCSGCSGAIDRVLGRLEGVESKDISLDTQTVKVTTNDTLDYDKVLAAIKKTGKEVRSGKQVA